MNTLNRAAAETARICNASGVTDVTGFGLLGHLSEMCTASEVSARVDMSSIDLLPGALELAESGVVPGGTRRNLEFVQTRVSFDNQIDPIRKLMLADAQTSGGLLISLPETEAYRFVSEFEGKPAFSAALDMSTIDAPITLSL